MGAVYVTPFLRDFSADFSDENSWKTIMPVGFYQVKANFSLLCTIVYRSPCETR
ncbi:hypothetical protein GGE09_001268 [Roseobacter sp. N2S]|nr:hypothetical protein [Roseobacter sp. N2S]